MDRLVEPEIAGPRGASADAGLRRLTADLAPFAVACSHPTHSWKETSVRITPLGEAGDPEDNESACVFRDRGPWPQQRRGPDSLSSPTRVMASGSRRTGS